MTKQQLRKSIKAAWAEQSTADLKAWSEDICVRITAHPVVMAAERIAAFWPLPDEPDIRWALLELKHRGKQILLPEIISDTEMTFDAEPQVMLTPGLAFDRQCNRMGRGRGYYDRWLCSRAADAMPNTTLCKPYTIGICFPYQIIDNLPVDEHDMPLDELI